jgi:tRNA A-37 threonylcarbamoyl transferase component Bud32/tetratricopeptide (TPR) repeat protein
VSTDIREQLQSTLSGAYTLERELGGGGMSRVFVADETRLGRKVVVKVLAPELAAGISADRFEREIKLAASLQQANIVPVLSTGDAAGLPYFTMPFVEGESLRARLARGPLSITEVTSILRDVARALAYAHERGVVHRDIKPDNVLLSRGTAVVTDFGIAKALAAARSGQRPERAESARDLSIAELTALGTALGTPAYMAPEQAAGDPTTDHRADFYAFGCMAYELLAGRPPFAGATLQKLFTAHMTETAQAVTELRPETPRELGSLVARCMAKDAAERPQSADELLAVLDAPSSSESALAGMPAILLGGHRMLQKALVVYAIAFLVVAIVAKAAIVGIGLPDWVFPGALIVMALGLPMILFAGYTQYAMRRMLTATPTVTPGGSRTTVPHGTLATLALKASPHLSWRRTMISGMAALGAFVLAVAAFMAVRALGIGPFGSFLATGRLQEREPVLVADFRTTGADSSLRDVLGELVRTDLAQSTAVTIVSPAIVASALQRMQRPASSRLDRELAREVALREGIKAIVDGEITPLGAGFIVSLRLVSADSGNELATFHETADREEELIGTIDKLTRSLRGRIGESLKTVHATQPLEQVTTPSLAALQKYAEGAYAHDILGDYHKAAGLLREAVTIDTTFAMAWRKLAVAMNEFMTPDSVNRAATKAYSYRDRLTERERLLATGFYFWPGPGHDRAKAIAAYEELVRRFPDGEGTNNLGWLYAIRREYARAESSFVRGQNSKRATAQLYVNAVPVQVAQGKFAAARATMQAGRARYPDSDVFDEWEWTIAYAEGKIDSAVAILTAVSRKNDPQRRVLAMRGLVAAALVEGKLAEFRRLSQMVAPPATRALGERMRAATIDAWFLEQPARAARRLDDVLTAAAYQAIPARNRPYIAFAIVYSLAGRPDRAKALLAEYDAWARDTSLGVQDVDRRRVLTEIALAENRPRDAIKELRRGDSLPDGPADYCEICMYARLARAYDRAAMSDSAIMYFERFVTTPYPIRLIEQDGDPLYLAGSYKRLGELYEARGDRQKAMLYYTKFVELWKNADPELQPKVAEVKKRLARLTDAEQKR